MFFNIKIKHFGQILCQTILFLSVSLFQTFLLSHENCFYSQNDRKTMFIILQSQENLFVMVTLK